jgi:hypothetical protein
MLGSSSHKGDKSSLESQSQHTSSTLTTALKTIREKPESKKTTSFNEEVATYAIHNRSYKNKDIFEHTDDKVED